MLSRHSIKPTLVRSQIRNINTYKHGSLVLCNDFRKKKRERKCTKISTIKSTRGPRIRNGTTYMQNIYFCFLLIVFWWLFGIISLNSSSVLLLSMECWKHTTLYNSDPVDTKPRRLLHHHREFHLNYIWRLGSSVGYNWLINWM